MWKRANSTKPGELDSISFQGTWHGKETTADAKGAATLIIHGSNLEFRAADTNEWYKATFSLYNTTPPQLVATITDCPSPEYVGLTSYAIWELKDGTLTLAGNEPGSPLVPPDFGAPDARTFVFKQK